MREINRHKKDISFLCVPIRIGAQPIGAMSADRLFSEEVFLEEDVRLLTIIASLLAQAIHVNSPRADKPFIKVNLAALPENILESELFGHERGAFTGAVSMREGRFEMAHGGTLFLDEIGDLPPSTQVKLLRVLQEKEFERVGSSKSIKVDVRVISATNRNLETLIEHGQFRMDLYYRLNLFPIFVPPLKERRTDIMLLADYFVERAGKKHGKQVRRISTPAIDMLMSYHWPGNVRELENCIERAVLVSADSVIHSHHLPPSLQTAKASGTMPQGKLEAALSALEYEMIVDALKFTRGNAASAARLLGISERLMGLRTRKFRIDPARYKSKTNEQTITRSLGAASSLSPQAVSRSTAHTSSRPAFGPAGPAR
jgi:Nif-specific regulatory protein